MRPPRADTEIRKLEEGTLEPLIQTIHVVKDDWKLYMSCIPKDLQIESSGNKYNDEDIRIVEEHANLVKEKCAKIMFNEWGTSGTRRPTLRTVQQVAVNAGMMRLADEIADLLRGTRQAQVYFGVSKNGNLKLVMNRYVYFLDYRYADGRRKWSCSNRNRSCKASAVTNGNIVVQRLLTHTHPFHDKKIMRMAAAGSIVTALPDGEKEPEKVTAEKIFEQGKPTALVLKMKTS